MEDSKNRKKIIIIGIVVLIFLIVLLFLLLGKPSYDVTFKVGNEVYGEPLKVKDGKVISLPKEPTKEGYTFDGWYFGEEKIDEDTKVSEDMTLEAKFNINSYTVTIDLDNDEEDIIQEVEYNNVVEKPSTPTKKGYNFAGWYLDDEVYDFNSKVTDDIEIVAKWTKKTTAKYTVEHYLMDVNGKYGSAYLVERNTGKIGNEVTPNTKVYKGFTAPQKESVVVTEDGDAIVKYYYVRNKYSITIKGDEGVKSTYGSGEYYYGSKIKIGALFNDGYELDKWSNKETKADYTYTIEDKDVDLNVSSKLINYTITYVGVFEGVKENITLEPKTYTIKDKVVLQDPSVEGYTFDRYVLNGNSIENNTIEVGTMGNLTIEVYFTANEYNVTFETTLGSFKTEDARVKVVKYKTLIPDVLKEEDFVPTREGYEVIGWSTDAEDEEQELYDFNTPMVAHDLTLYPVWKVIDYKLSFKLSEDEVCTNCTNYNSYNIESNINLPTPAREGYSFAGWIVNDTEEVIKNIEIGRTGDIELVAKWRKIIYIADIDNILNEETGFINTVNEDESKVLVGYKDVYKNKTLDQTLIYKLKANLAAVLSDEHFTKMEIANNEINPDNFEDTLKTLLDVEDLLNVTYGNLVDKNFNVVVTLNKDNAIADNNKSTITYNISFRELTKITSSEMAPIITENEATINQYKDEHYEVVVEENDNDYDLIFKYRNPKGNVYNTMSGAGLRTAMQSFLGHTEKIGYIVITFRSMGPTKVAYENIRDNKYWAFGLKLLGSFEKALGGKDAFDLVNEDLLELEATLDIYAADGTYFDEDIITHYNIKFADNSVKKD